MSKQASKDETTDKQVVRHLEHVMIDFCKADIGRALTKSKYSHGIIFKAFDFSLDQLIEVLIPLAKKRRILIGSCLDGIAIQSLAASYLGQR